LGLEENDAVKVDCSEPLTQSEIYRQKTSGTQWEKKVWAEIGPVLDAAEAEAKSADEAAYDAYMSQFEDGILPTSSTSL
jgi:hypothetical protein